MKAPPIVQDSFQPHDILGGAERELMGLSGTSCRVLIYWKQGSLLWLLKANGSGTN